MFGEILNVVKLLGLLYSVTKIYIEFWIVLKKV